MDKDYITNFHHKFDEDDINHRRKVVLEDINRYLKKRNPDLMDASHLTVSKNSRSVLDLCGICLTKTINGKQRFWFLCLLGNCYNNGHAVKIQRNSTCNGTSHLSTKHVIMVPKTAAHKRNVATLCKYIEGADELFSGKPYKVV
jgi:hypothetical protein